jgi:curved DNA-binding protein CbpA
MRRDSEIDHYAVLGVPHDASAPEIRRAYRRLARQHHPDLNPQPAQPGRFVALVRAYEILNDPVRRARYDRGLAPAESDAQASAAPPQSSPAASRDDRVRVDGTIELTPDEAEHVARLPLVLTDLLGGVIVVPAGIDHGDRITVRHRGRPVRLSVRVQGKT